MCSRNAGRVKYRLVRSFVLLFFSVAFVAAPSVQRGALDPAFEKIPFDQWLRERDQARFRWTASVPRAELSFHQRLMTRVERMAGTWRTVAMAS
jgi:hypothetical protein